MKKPTTPDAALKMLRAYVYDLKPEKVGAIEIKQEAQHGLLRPGAEKELLYTEVTIRMRVLP